MVPRFLRSARSMAPSSSSIPFFVRFEGSPCIARLHAGPAVDLEWRVRGLEPLHGGLGDRAVLTVGRSASGRRLRWVRCCWRQAAKKLVEQIPDGAELFDIYKAARTVADVETANGKVKGEVGTAQSVASDLARLHAAKMAVCEDVEQSHLEATAAKARSFSATLCVCRKPRPY